MRAERPDAECPSVIPAFSLRASARRGSLALGAVVAGVLAAPPPAPLMASLFVAPTGSDANGCSRAAPCASLGAAYASAAEGDVVDVAEGTYRP
ncbi:MAG TPA: hypothetical protein VNW68_05195, partial [Candidatus Limnocylindria bacterium]|nr:hypothetical protein [Candidatus Limnocylindria bacterium]